jgi:putative hemolysin
MDSNNNDKKSDIPDLNIPEGTLLGDTLLQMLKYNILNKVYSQAHDKDPLFLINSLLNELDLKYELPEEDLKNIPAEGAFITVSNHPYRGIDSMILYRIISQKRKDFRIMASYLLHQITSLREIVIPVNTFETAASIKSSFAGIKEGIIHLKDGHPLAIFPVGEVSSQIEVSKIIVDKEWQNAAIKFIKNAGVPIVPVYFHGTRPRLSHIVGKVHPLLRTIKLPAELTQKKNRTVQVRIGSPITVKEQSDFENIFQFGKYLRARIYSLGSALKVKKFFSNYSYWRKPVPEPLADPVPVSVLTEEFNTIRKDYELFTIKNYTVVCAPTPKIPEIFNEIGRLRELTFRKVGEGTNKSADIDEYDIYFNHLFIWDTEENRIVGAYRIGKGREILDIYGIRGFYIDSLFKISPDFRSVLSKSLELGRSFIVEEYQKKTIPLFLLWKGIMVFLLKNAEYRYLIGPVSISNDFFEIFQKPDSRIYPEIFYR